MIVVLGIFEVEAADRQRFLDEKAAQVRATRTETGCIDYAFAADAGDPGRVRLVEKWESMEALEAHVAGLRAAPPPERPGVASRPVTVEVLEAQPVRPPWA
jgi:quinol monooxygenase YgiN